MNKLRLQTKIEVLIGVLLILMTLVISVASISRTITSDSDNIDTFIRNSNGNYWEATGANIQKAIDDLSHDDADTWGGTVYLPGNTTFTLTEPIKISTVKGWIGRRNLIIQGDGRSTILKGDNSFNIIDVEDGWYIILRDFKITDGLDGINVKRGEAAEDNHFDIFENLYIEGCLNDGIHLFKSYIISIFNCYCVDNGGDGLWIDTDGGGSYNINGGGYWNNDGTGINVSGDGLTGISINGVSSEKNGYDGINLYSARCASITGCYTEGNGRYSFKLGGYNYSGSHHSYDISLIGCYAKDKRVHIDAPNCVVKQCYIRGYADTVSIEATGNTNGLIIESGNYPKGFLFNGQIISQGTIVMNGHLSVFDEDWNSGYWHIFSFGASELDTFGSGATQEVISGTSVSSWNLDAVTEYIYCSSPILYDWDASTDMIINITGYLTNDENVNDDIDMTVDCYYGQSNDNVYDDFKFQELSMDYDIGNDNNQYDTHTLTFTFDYDKLNNVLEKGDILNLRINLDDISNGNPVESFNVVYIELKYKTPYPQVHT